MTRNLIPLRQLATQIAGEVREIERDLAEKMGPTPADTPEEIALGLET